MELKMLKWINVCPEQVAKWVTAQEKFSLKILQMLILKFI
jgi:hypothetical protein